jgi:hypothetical protein
MMFESALVKSRYFESLQAYSHDRKWQQAALTAAGERYRFHRHSIWLSFNPIDAPEVDRGFKLHIAPDFAHLDDQVYAALEVLVRANIAFKFIADERLLRLTNSKNYSRAQSAKFFAAYPDSDAQFHAVARELAERLAPYQGAYILTDRRVPGSQCVGYRYGAYQSITVPNGLGGEFQLIRNADGQLVEDRREPQFHLPDGVRDPFGEPDEALPTSVTLADGRYEVTAALHFSNSGGVYKATDTVTKKTVAIKEARRFAGVRGGINAQDALRHEHCILERLAGTETTPAPIALFEEWESLFLVQEFIDAATWHATFATEKYFLMPFVPGVSRVVPFLDAIVPAALSAIQGLRAIHGAGVIVGDVSPNNIMIDAEVGVARFIDVESAIEAGSASSWQRQWKTPGFARSNDDRTEMTAADDWFGLGKCLVSAVMSFGEQSHLGGMSAEQMVDTVVEFVGLPHPYALAAKALLSGQPDEAEAFLIALRAQLAEPAAHLHRVDGALSRPLRATDQPIGAESLSSMELVARTANAIEGAYRGPEAHEFWPADPALYRSDRFCLAYGGCGVAAFLRSCDRLVPASFDAALSAYRPGQSADPGLFTGLAGVAFHAARIGDVGTAERMMQAIAGSSLRFTSTGVLCGEAGIGMGALSVSALTGSTTAAQIAHSAAAYLMETAVTDEHGHAYWRLTERTTPIHFGYLTGVTGVTFFLSQYAEAFGNQPARRLARQGMEYVLANARTDQRGNLAWGVHTKDSRSLPYFGDGSAGIGSVLARLGLQWNDRDYLRLAERVAQSSFSRLALYTGQFTGLAGILELMSDMCGLGIEPGYHAKLGRDIIDGLKRYAVLRAHGVEFPGVPAVRLSCDAATGSAGVATAIARAAIGGPRDFIDFWLPSKNLFADASGHDGSVDRPPLKIALAH